MRVLGSGLLEGFLSLVTLQDVRPDAQPLHQVIGGDDSDDGRDIQFELNRDRVQEEIVRLFIRVVHAPAPPEVFPTIKMIAEMPDVVAPAEGHELILSILFDLLSSTSEVLAVSAP